MTSKRPSETKSVKFSDYISTQDNITYNKKGRTSYEDYSNYYQSAAPKKDTPIVRSKTSAELSYPNSDYYTNSAPSTNNTSNTYSSYNDSYNYSNRYSMPQRSQTSLDYSGEYQSYTPSSSSKSNDSYQSYTPISSSKSNDSYQSYTPSSSTKSNNSYQSYTPSSSSKSNDSYQSYTPISSSKSNDSYQSYMPSSSTKASDTYRDLYTNYASDVNSYTDASDYSSSPQDFYRYSNKIEQESLFEASFYEDVAYVPVFDFIGTDFSSNLYMDNFVDALVYDFFGVKYY